MAKLSNINGKFAVEDTGAIRFSDQTGTTGQILKSNGNSAPTWVDPNTVGTGPWLPLAGGVVSGATTFQSSLTVGGTISVNATTSLLLALNSTNTNGGYLRIMKSGATEFFIGTRASVSGTSGTGYDIYTIAGNDLRFFTNGTNLALTIDTSQNVGIGTTSPVSKFEVDGSIKVTGITSNIGATAGLSLSYDSGINYINTWASTPLITSTYNYQAFHISGSEKMRIHTNGNIGIGTDSPDFALDIEGLDSGVQLQIGRTNTSAGSTWMGSDSNGFHLGVGAYGAGNSVADPNGFTVDTSGNVGIGLDPVYKLDVRGDRIRLNPNSDDFVTAEIQNTTGSFYFGIDNSTGSSFGGANSARTIFSLGDYPMAFYTNSTERMRITGAGTIQMTDENGGVPILQVRNFATTATGAFTDAYAMEFRGATTSGASGGMMLLHMNEADNARPTLNVSDSNGIFATFTNGKVGIGTTSPDTKLHVEGPTGTKNRSTTGGSSVYETTKYFGVSGNSTANISIDTPTVFPPMASGGFILVEVSASGYGNSGSNGLVFSYITGGYGGHYAAVNQPYHPVVIIANSMQAGTCTWYNPNATTIGITVTTTNSAGLNGVMRVKVTTTY